MSTLEEFQKWMSNWAQGKEQEPTPEEKKAEEVKRLEDPYVQRDVEKKGLKYDEVKQRLIDEEKQERLNETKRSMDLIKRRLKQIREGRIEYDRENNIEPKDEMKEKLALLQTTPEEVEALGEQVTGFGPGVVSKVQPAWKLLKGTIKASGASIPAKNMAQAIEQTGPSQFGKVIATEESKLIPTVTKKIGEGLKEGSEEFGKVYRPDEVVKEDVKKLIEYAESKFPGQTEKVKEFLKLKGILK